MSFASCGAFGGTLKINGKEYSVRGRTYGKIAEQINWWKAECFCPIVELRLLLGAHPEFMDEDFVFRWLKVTKEAMFSDDELQNKALSTFSARRFDIWQACSEDGLRLEDIDEFLDYMTGEELRSFFEEADKKMALANGVREIEYLANCFSMAPSKPKAGGSIEAMLAQACVHSKNRLQIHEILNCTPAAIRTLFQDPEAINANAVLDGPVHPNDKQGQKRFAKVLRNAALNIVEGRRIDAYREPEAKPKTEEKTPSKPEMPLTAKQAKEAARKPESETELDP